MARTARCSDGIEEFEVAVGTASGLDRNGVTLQTAVRCSGGPPIDVEEEQAGEARREQRRIRSHFHRQNLEELNG